MKPDNQTSQQLEQFVSKYCRQQPLRTAPATLQARVMRELQARAALPWWRKSFVHWPLWSQVLFVMAALLAAKLALMIADKVGGHWLVSTGAAARSSALVQSVGTIATVSHDVSSQLFGMIPVSFIYGAVFVVAMLYLVLFGIGVTTYKTLYAAR
ncbi:MAG TPA: hypothetical protein VG962_15405 [Steroidobacteraceae bacterium]|nr:hypothetical protein [Steroidobacteraceae bacterium]